MNDVRDDVALPEWLEPVREAARDLAPPVSRIASIEPVCSTGSSAVTGATLASPSCARVAGVRPG